MVDIPHKEVLLETIDQLRKRKARPDLERICHMLERKHGISFDETKDALAKLVDAAVVFKVDYKGNTSYRNAAKWKKWGTKNCLNPFTTSTKIWAAVKAFTDAQAKETGGRGSGEEEGAGEGTGEAASPRARQDSDSSGGGDVGSPSLHPLDPDDNTGASLEDIEKWLREVHPDFKQDDPSLEVIVEREVDVGHLERLQNGKLVNCITPKPGSPESSHGGGKPKKPRSNQGSPSAKSVGSSSATPPEPQRSPTSDEVGGSAAGAGKTSSKSAAAAAAVSVAADPAAANAPSGGGSGKGSGPASTAPGGKGGAGGHGKGQSPKVKKGRTGTKRKVRSHSSFTTLCAVLVCNSSPYHSIRYLSCQAELLKGPRGRHLNTLQSLNAFHAGSGMTSWR